MPKTVTHPIATAVGLNIPLAPDSTLYFYPNPAIETAWEVARVSLMGDSQFQFSVKDFETERIFGATFDGDGEVISMECSTGLPKGKMEEVAAMFCEQLRDALEHMQLLQ